MSYLTPREESYIEMQRQLQDYYYINREDDDGEEPVICAYCRDRIFEYDDIYKIGDDLIHYDEDGDCLFDYFTEDIAVCDEIDGELWYEFDHAGKHYLLKNEKGIAKKLMVIFEDCRQVYH